MQDSAIYCQYDGDDSHTEHSKRIEVEYSRVG
jgi:hypothetical protein